MSRNLTRPPQRLPAPAAPAAASGSAAAPDGGGSSSGARRASYSESGLPTSSAWTTGRASSGEPSLSTPRDGIAIRLTPAGRGSSSGTSPPTPTGGTPPRLLHPQAGVSPGAMLLGVPYPLPRVVLRLMLGLLPRGSIPHPDS
ncbi:unnamed protein product, partial [Pylaiella littoralis]